MINQPTLPGLNTVQRVYTQEQVEAVVQKSVEGILRGLGLMPNGGGRGTPHPRTRTQTTGSVCWVAP